MIEQSHYVVFGLRASLRFWMAVFSPEAETTGPNLKDLPSLVEQIAKKENLNVVSGINLDGGGASAVYSSTGQLKEIQPVGSWWCIR